MKKINLNNLTEYQKSLLTSLAYLDIDFHKFQNLKDGQSRITISDLRFLISNPDEPYLGILNLPEFKIFMTGVTTTNLEFIEKLECAKLGDLEVIDLAHNIKSGFNGICFRDSIHNVGFSFRGTDLKTFSSLVADGLADIEAFLTNNTEQITQAQILFHQHQNLYGHNFLYGHSLGGFLAENVYLQNYENISNAFVINPLHINSQLLDNQKKIDAFNHPEKFSCFVTGGDYVSSINTPDLFSTNIYYVKNNNENINNPIANHLIEAGEFDENGNFVRCSKEEAFLGHTSQLATSAIHFINKEQIKKLLINVFLSPKTWFSAAKIHLSNFFKKRKPSKDKKNKTANSHTTSDFQRYIDPKSYINPEHQERNPQRAENVFPTVPTNPSEDYIR